ncbi:MAG: hypothetical protein V4636_05405 [Pseudomonadota bacterium]
MSKGSKTKAGEKTRKVSGRKISVALDERRTVSIFRADGGQGIVITGATEGQEPQSISFSEEAFAAIVAMYEELLKEFVVWTVKLKEADKS